MGKEFYLASANGTKAECLARLIGSPVTKIHVEVDETVEGLPQNYLLPLIIAKRKVKTALLDPLLSCEQGATIVGTDILGFVHTDKGLRILGKPKNWSEALEFARLISKFGVTNVAGTVMARVGSDHYAMGGAIIETPSIKGFDDGHWLYYSDCYPERVLAAATGIDLFYGLSLLEKTEILVGFLSRDGKRERLTEYKDFDPEKLSLALKDLIHGFSSEVLAKLAAEFN